MANLLKNNLAEAANLSLVVASTDDLVKIGVTVDDVWLEPYTELERFYIASSRLISKLHGKTVAIGSFRAKSIAISRVFPIRFLEYLFIDAARGPDPTKNEIIKQAISDLKIASSVESPNTPSNTDLVAINQANAIMEVAFDSLRAQVCALGGVAPNASLLVRALVQPGKSCWVGRKPNTRGGSSQYWRDSLGLEHYPHSEGAVWSPCLGDRLVRVSFTAKTSTLTLSPTDSQSMLKKHPKDLWLVRPTIVHEGNTRFIQRHHSDKPGIPLKQGRTIDIKDPHYSEGERELILYHGAEARVTWRDAELLDGIPQRQAHDLDHHSFVSIIGSRYGW